MISEVLKRELGMVWNMYTSRLCRNSVSVPEEDKQMLSVILERQRDRAHIAIKEIFYKVIQKRRKSTEKEDDILQTLIDASYKNGRALNDDEIE
ncbi:hypothetical protein KOW79_012709 [Hemibagrus wyckioides]|uniref:Uncharacterized protein n=1 Tax=Hemibagrus wyckioides TaxID=337641 RepID=A0A9D3SMD0_9TELE|nr:hypothetical protein KOW79_012709 [Hemibagrus wyckioides]